MSTLGIILISPGHERAHYALVLATGAAALGREVILFATNAGIRLLLANRALEADGREAEVAATGVAGIHDLLEAARDMGVQLRVCEAGRLTEGLAEAPLLEGTVTAGVVGLLADTLGGQIITL